MKSTILKLTTGVSSGACTVLAPTAICGELYALEYQPGDIATGATLTVTSLGANGAEKPLLTKANAGTSNAWFYPRDLVHAVADGSALTGTAGGDRTKPIINGVLKVAISSGDNSKTGYLIAYYED